MSRLIIPITTARGMGPLPSMLEKMESVRALQRVFSNENLPLELVENRDMQLPQKSLVALFEGAAQAVGDRLFGLRVGQSMTPGDYGMWIRFSSGGRTLAEALQRCVRSISVHQSVAKMSLHKAGSTVVWSYHPPPLADNAGIQHSDHIVPLMIRFVQAYLGANWNPSWVNIGYSSAKSDVRLEDELKSNVRYFGNSVSIAIPKKYMQVSRSNNLRSRTQSVTSVDILAEKAKTQTNDLISCINAVITLQLLEGQTSIDETSFFIGTSTRTLQRTIHEAGSSYRQLMDAARMKRALALLRETNSSILDISLTLGYSDPSNFTRSFVRSYGRSPSTVRQQNENW